VSGSAPPPFPGRSIGILLLFPGLKVCAKPEVFARNTGEVRSPNLPPKALLASPSFPRRSIVVRQHGNSVSRRSGPLNVYSFCLSI
jgi:hypothetical protein